MKYISTQTLILLALTGMLAMGAQAHMIMPGPLPKELLEHAEDIDYLSRVAGLDTDDSSKGLYGLHYYYALDSGARRLTLKLLNSKGAEAQIAALRIIGHCGGVRIVKIGEDAHDEANDKDISIEINDRLGVLSSSANSEVSKSALEVKRTLRKREEELTRLAAITNATAEKAPSLELSVHWIRASAEHTPNIGYSLINNEKFSVTIGLMSCSKMDNWSLDKKAEGKLVWPDFHGCDKNICVAHTLKPGESLKGTLVVEIFYSTGKRMPFSLHLKTCSSSKKDIGIKEFISKRF